MANLSISCWPHILAHLSQSLPCSHDSQQHAHQHALARQHPILSRSYLFPHGVLALPVCQPNPLGTPLWHHSYSYNQMWTTSVAVFCARVGANARMMMSAGECCGGNPLLERGVDADLVLSFRRIQVMAHTSTKFYQVRVTRMANRDTKFCSDLSRRRGDAMPGAACGHSRAVPVGRTCGNSSRKHANMESLVNGATGPGTHSLP